jgi:hypothetical protein
MADEGHGGAVTLIQRFGSAANLDIQLYSERSASTPLANPLCRSA